MDIATLGDLNFMDLVTAYGLKILSALAIFIIGRYVAKLVLGLVKKAMNRASVDTTLSSFAVNILNIVILAFIVIASLGALGVETTSLAAVIAAAGLAVGLALQGSLANFAAGVLLTLFRPFKNGDYVVAGGIDGTVKEVSIFTTILVSPDGIEKIIPNGQIISREIVNYNTQPSRRVDMEFGVAYNADIDQVRSIISEVLSKNDKVLQTPAPVIAVASLGDNSVNFVVRPYVANADYWTVRFEVIENVKKALDAAKVSIPFPQRDVYVYNMDKKS
ncbi:MAG: small conductance mechanosensitive channel [Alphaproteobacteria bacterium]|jgi:small conductance mechanosensitive channel